jgi:SAM-dependent methyltransferase
MLSSSHVDDATPVASGAKFSLRAGFEWGLDRMVAVGYGVVYDYIFERFRPYQDLHQEVYRLIEASRPDGAERAETRILNVACGPGNFACALGAAGYSVVGLDRYLPLVELAREKQRAQGLGNVAFRHGDLAAGAALRKELFDYVVNIHSLYVHPDPTRLLHETWRVLKPGGHAILVNHTRHIGLGATFGGIRNREGLNAALGALVWLVPNAVFEFARKRTGPHYWGEDEFASRVVHAGFSLLDMRRTFLEQSSLLAWARKPREE